MDDEKPSSIMLDVMQSIIEVHYWAHDKVTVDELRREVERYHMPMSKFDAALESMVSDDKVSIVKMDDGVEYVVPGDDLQREMKASISQSTVPFVQAGAEGDYVYDKKTNTYRDLHDDSDWQDLGL